MSEKLVSQRQELRGVGVSSGIGFGHARVMQTSSLQVPRYSVTAEDVDKEIGRLRKSVSSVSRARSNDSPLSEKGAERS